MPVTDAEFLRVAGAPPRRLTFGAVFQVLERGHQRPLLCQLEENGKPAGLWVVKPPFPGRTRGSSGQLMALCELAGSEVCVWAGVPTPDVGLVRLPDETVDVGHLPEGDRDAARTLLDANRGRLAFCSRRLEPGAVDANAAVLRRRRRRQLVASTGFAMLLVDALIRNVDRRLANPNALLFRGELVAIDHGHAFDGIENSSEGAALARTASLAFMPQEHLLVGALRAARDTLTPAPFLGVGGLRDQLATVAAAWPDELDAVALEGQSYKTRLVSFLEQRLAHPQRTVDSVFEILGSSS